MQNKKIALYSGEIPSTTFIERLIDGLAEKHTVLLFGFQKKSVQYKSKNIKIIGYNGKISKLVLLLKYTILLTFSDNKNKTKLDKIIANKSGNSFILKSKYYPILYHKPEIFHMQWAKNITDWMWVQEFDIKLILSLRGTHITISPYANEVLMQNFIELFPKIDSFHAVSQSIKNQVILEYAIEPSKIKVVYSGLDINKFNVLNPKESKSVHQKFKIVSIGRNHWVKGYNNALDCCKILKDNGFDFKYEIIGIDEKSEELIFQKSQLGLENNVDFINFLPFDNVLKTISSADILLLPSVEEGIANVVLEAMASGTIVLSTNCGGLNEVIVDGDNGFLTPIRNAAAMANKILEIAKLTNDQKLIIKQNARITIENQHSFLKMINGFEALYNTVSNG
jgi:colanic acid/amylovoran biosynthesis glycosyltransferase